MGPNKRVRGKTAKVLKAWYCVPCWDAGKEWASILKELLLESSLREDRRIDYEGCNERHIYFGRL